MTKVFIDGSAGTTGLRIHQRLMDRQDIELQVLPEAIRKDMKAREEAINAADIVFLCLPDDAARESVSLVHNDHTVIIDTSTAHRTAPGWTYGFAEVCGLREQIRTSRRIANPGCHASGFIALAAPLSEAGVLAADAQLSCFSLTGYSGGGKKMIADYEENLPAEADAPEHARLLQAPRMYGLTQYHKHLPEMAQISRLEKEPLFCPIVAPYYSGMEVTIPLSGKEISVGIREIQEIYAAYYKEGLVHYAQDADEEGFLSAAAYSGRDDMQISVFGNEERILLVSRFDNLGKGASGAAIQNMNLVMGTGEGRGLVC